MSNPRPATWLHRYALATPCIAMVTVIAGALVTSRNAGMAFRDWPTSDGRGMLAYPWLADFARDWDKFLEHGHRLAGVLIGLWSIGLAVLLLWKEPRRWVKLAGVGILCAVIVQGILGGFRVWLDERGLAMVHGLFAACVISLMASVATALGPGWQEAAVRPSERDVGVAKPLALLSVAMLLFQFVLGGLIRHGGRGLYEHLTIGIVSLVLIAVNAIAAHAAGISWLRRSGWTLLAVVLLQVALGAGTWIVKYGLASVGYVAVADSIQQVVLRTAHAVLGILVVTAAAVHAVRVLRVDAFAPREVAAVYTPARGSAA